MRDDFYRDDLGIEDEDLEVGAEEVEEPAAGEAEPEMQPTGLPSRSTDRPTVEYVVVRVLGPVEVTGWEGPSTRRVLTELVCFLALHTDRVVAGDELRAALRPEDDGASETSAKSLRNYMTLLRRVLGPDRLPPATTTGGYRLGPGVTSDWTMFTDLVRGAIPGGADEAAQLREALELVRGRPFAGVPAGTYGWVFAELWSSRIEVAVTAAAHRLTAIALGVGDTENATWALRQGLLAAPYDRSLWDKALEVAILVGPDEETRVRRDTKAVLGEDITDLDGGHGG